jgi:transcriptional regulator with XRE-family HTH domain
MTDMVTRIGGARKPHLYIMEWIGHLELSVEKVADRIGVRRETVYRWIKTPTRLDPAKMQQLADALDIPITALYRRPEHVSLDDKLEGAPDDVRQQAIEYIDFLTRRRA